MNIFQAIIFGLVQGITEFLPISSSGHLVISQYIFQLQEPQLAFDVFLHLSSLVAIFVFFFPKLKKITWKEIWFIGIGTIPAVVVGLFFKDALEGLFSSVKLVGITLIITGIINLFTDRSLEKMKPGTTKKFAELGWKNALVIGLFQSFALIPGISRSGSTLAGSISQKLDRQSAFDFAFLLAIPAILGAGLLQFIDLTQSGFSDINYVNFLLGGGAAFLSGLASLKAFNYIIKNARMEWFGWYCMGIGSLVLLFI